MSPERLVQVKQIFDRAIELPPTERRLFVQQTCVGDADLESTVMELLKQDQEELPSATPGPEPAQTLPLEALPLLKDRYQILREIDRGGMGIVLLGG